MIESLQDRSISTQIMHAFILYHISPQGKIHVNSITLTVSHISCCFKQLIEKISNWACISVNTSFCTTLKTHEIPYWKSNHNEKLCKNLKRSIIPICSSFMTIPEKLPLALGNRKLLQFYYNLLRSVHTINVFLNRHGKQVPDSVCKSRVLRNKPRVFGEQYTVHKATPKRKATRLSRTRDAKPPKTLRFRGLTFSRVYPF